MVSMIQTSQNEAVKVDGLDEVTQKTTYNEEEFTELKIITQSYMHFKNLFLQYILWFPSFFV